MSGPRDSHCASIPSRNISLACALPISWPIRRRAKRASLRASKRANEPLSLISFDHPLEAPPLAGADRPGARAHWLVGLIEVASRAARFAGYCCCCCCCCWPVAVLFFSSQFSCSKSKLVPTFASAAAYCLSNLAAAAAAVAEPDSDGRAKTKSPSDLQLGGRDCQTFSGHVLVCIMLFSWLFGRVSMNIVVVRRRRRRHLVANLRREWPRLMRSAHNGAFKSALRALARLHQISSNLLLPIRGGQEAGTFLGVRVRALLVCDFVASEMDAAVWAKQSALEEAESVCV